MSVAAVAWAFEQKLPANEKIVLLSLADCENGQTALCIPGQERLAEMASMSVRSVQRHLASLETRGLIRREHRTSAVSGYRTSDSYVLALRDNLSGGTEPTRQIGQANTTTVSGIREPEEEPEDTPPTPSWQDELFEQLWESWPKKSAKKDARRAFDRMCKSQHHNATQITVITTLLARHGAEHRKHTPPQFQPMLSTIINGERWNDPLPVSRERGAYRPEPQQPATPKIPFGHRPVWSKDGYIIGSEPIE